MSPKKCKKTNLSHTIKVVDCMASKKGRFRIQATTLEPLLTCATQENRHAQAVMDTRQPVLWRKAPLCAIYAPRSPYHASSKIILPLILIHAVRVHHPQDSAMISEASPLWLITPETLPAVRFSNLSPKPPLQHRPHKQINGRQFLQPQNLSTSLGRGPTSLCSSISVTHPLKKSLGPIF